MISHHLDAIAAITVSGAAVIGAKFGNAFSTVIADSTDSALPGWTTAIFGPLGALVCLLLALLWLTKRLAAAEEKAEKRETERTAKIEAMQEKHAEKLESITHAAMKVTSKVATSLDALVEELQHRPCGMGMKNGNRIEEE